MSGDLRSQEGFPGMTPWALLTVISWRNDLLEKQKPAKRLVFAVTYLKISDLLGEAQHEIDQLFDVRIGNTR
jgi:hypothetical protein